MSLETKHGVDLGGHAAGNRITEDFLPNDHPLSANAVRENLPLLTSLMLNGKLDELWDLETRRLPRPLQKLRTKNRDFAQREMAPLARELDAMEHWPVGQTPEQLTQLLQKATDAGLMSDIAPWPVGTGRLTAFPYPLQWVFALKTEEFARACGGQMLYLCATMLGQAPIVASGNVITILRHLAPGIFAMRRGKPYVYAFAITEPHAGSDVEEGIGAATSTPGLVAKPVDGGWVLNGRKVFISGGDVASGIVVFAALEGEGYDSWTGFFVKTDSPGFKPVRTELKMGMRASGATELEFDNVFVSKKDLIGKVRGGWAINKETLNLSRLPVAAIGVGFAQAAIDIVTDYARTTKVGGEPLILQQSFQLALADMIAQTSSARSLVWAAASTWRIHQSASAMSKFQASDTGISVIDQAMDLLGPEAVLHRTRLEGVWRDARLVQIFEGTNQINRLGVIEGLADYIVR